MIRSGGCPGAAGRLPAPRSTANGRSPPPRGQRGTSGARAKFSPLLPAFFLSLSPLSLADLPRGWEEGFSEEGASYFIE